MGESVMPEYSQGICGDGAAILKDGVMLTIDEIVAELNAAAQHERIVAGLEGDAARYRALRDSTNCSLSISHNDHHNMYLSVADTMDDSQGYYSHVPADERQKMIDTDTIWTLQVYPDTPIGFYTFHGATLDNAIDAFLAQTEEGVES